MDPQARPAHGSDGGMNDASIDRLQAAANFVGDELRTGAREEDIIQALIRVHGATVKGWDPYRLRCAGVVGTCTWSKGVGLLNSWQRNATVKLMKARQ